MPGPEYARVTSVCFRTRVAFPMFLCTNDKGARILERGTQILEA